MLLRICSAVVSDTAVTCCSWLCFTMPSCSRPPAPVDATGWNSWPGLAILLPPLLSSPVRNPAAGRVPLERPALRPAQQTAGGAAPAGGPPGSWWRSQWRQAGAARSSSGGRPPRYDLP